MKLYVDTKPVLEWSGYHAPFYFNAHTMFGMYQIYHDECKDGIDLYIVRLYDLKCEFGDDLLDGEAPVCPLAEAKQYAQADYDRRTAERFREVELPLRTLRVDELYAIIQSAIGAGKGGL